MNVQHRELVLRLEGAEAAVARNSAVTLQRLRPDSGVAVEKIAGGYAVFMGPSSPLTQAIHVGLEGEVNAEEFSRLEEFFHSRGASPAISLCPWTHPTLLEHIGKSGYRITHFENVLCRTLSAADLLPVGATVRRAQPSEAADYSRLIMKGFGEGQEPSPEMVDLFTNLFDLPGCSSWFAIHAGVPAGGAGMSVQDGTAIFFGDATLPEFRGRGLHLALIGARLLEAARQSCDLIVACTIPGSVSQRNYERSGFRVAYTRTMLGKEPAA